MFGLQNPDGGFPCRGTAGNPSCLNDTSFMIGRMIAEPSSKTTGSLHRACEWILSTQSEEGAFIEPSELSSIPDLPPWVPPGKPSPLMPQLISYLLDLGYGGRDEVKKAIKYLLDHWLDANGSFKPGYLVWCLVEVLVKTGSTKDSPKVERALRATRAFLKDTDDPPALLWCLNSLRSAGFTKEDDIVRELSTSLLSLRRDDGGWANEDSQGRIQNHSDPAMTRRILDTLRSFGLI